MQTIWTWCRGIKRTTRNAHFRMLGVAGTRIIVLTALICMSLTVLRWIYVAVGEFEMKSTDYPPVGTLIHNNINIRENEHTQSTLDKPRLRCAKKTNVAFLKVHKAGSTTIMNIFLRFAINNNLNIVLPQKSEGFAFNYLGYGKTLERDGIVPLPGNETYNILCNHVVYNRSAFQDIMPPDTIYLGILREPVSQFKSAVLYYGFKQQLDTLAMKLNLSKETDMMHEFLRSPNSFKNVSPLFIHNRMSFDLGVPTERFADSEFIHDYINGLKKDFSVMMLMEQLDESLVLMKRLLCWELKEMLYVPLNKMSREAPKLELADEDVVNLKKWNQADQILYQRFSDVFSGHMEMLGPDFTEEVLHFKTVQSNVFSYCLSLNISDSTSTLRVETSRWNDEFYVSLRECLLMTEPELHMMSRLIKAAWARYDEYKSEQGNNSFNG